MLQCPIVGERSVIMVSIIELFHLVKKKQRTRGTSVFNSNCNRGFGCSSDININEIVLLGHVCLRGSICSFSGSWAKVEIGVSYEDDFGVGNIPLQH
jgi:hypothetical protein